MPNNNSYVLLVDWSNGSTEYINATSKSDRDRRLKNLRQVSDIEYITVLENPKQAYIWCNPNCSPEGSWT